ncbi:hypothetical protein CY34DRAFT_558936 [Suillus luteus UH-Slu-Lm8-n1]|uniref:Uncharacterized protein n=1 Tax=Suillus luteus UH-Slu-Lm8-n1 TaxID=930992 RepID=A0A0D0BGD6_9AGAM|nr:hypothetical protein CY34DRAFT_558936 [Suillus luteus UH-Slu-Lm8-n1]
MTSSRLLRRFLSEMICLLSPSFPKYCHRYAQKRSSQYSLSSPLSSKPPQDPHFFCRSIQHRHLLAIYYAFATNQTFLFHNLRLDWESNELPKLAY